jgi:DNA-binding FadR family transcriptional regulator
MTPKPAPQQLSVAPLRKRRLADEVYAQILSQLAAHHYATGDRLPTEHALAEQFSVSRPVIRDALKQLQNDGLIGARRGAGTFVLRLPPQDMAPFAQDVQIADYIRAYEIRQSLECEAARLAAQRADKADISSIGKALDMMERALNTAGENATEADFQFHITIARATHNDLFERQILSLRPEMTGTMRIASQITTNRPPERTARVLQEHRDIFNAIEAGDGNLARLYMQYHLVSVRNRILDQSL